MNVLEHRRRLMMLKPRKWYPIIQGPITTQDMINELGDLFQTYEDAPDAFNNRQKTSAFAFAKSVTSATFGGNIYPMCIVYEEGQAPIMLTRAQTITFTSTQTYKHVVCYSGTHGGRQALSGVKWCITTGSWSSLQYTFDLGVKYWHIPYGSNAPTWISDGIYMPNPRGYTGSVYYIPDWWSGAINSQRFKLCSKLRLSKGVSAFYGYAIYYWGTRASDLPNLTDIYVHWGLGEVPRQPGTYYIGPWKLHIPDLGNAEDNAALVAEYRSKNWGLASGLGIFNDVEATEPQEQLD